jgi:vacuolar-type H+-ATPase subunit E/Vma4
MSSKNTLKEEVLREFAAEAEQILAEAKENADLVLADARAEQDRMRRRAENEVEREVASRRTRELSRVRIEQRNRTLNTEKEIIDALFGKACRQLIGMAEDDPSRYGELLWTFFSNSRKLLPKGKIRVILGDGGDAFEKRADAGKEIEIRNESGFHGLILETMDGRIRCDYRLESILRSLRKAREAEVREILFETEHGQ